MTLVFAARESHWIFPESHSSEIAVVFSGTDSIFGEFYYRLASCSPCTLTFNESIIRNNLHLRCVATGD